MNIRSALPILLATFLVGCARGNESVVKTQADISSGSVLVVYPQLEEVYSFTMPSAEIRCYERTDQPLYIFCQSATNPGSSNGLWIKQGDEILAVDVQAKGLATTMEMGLYEQADNVDTLSIYKSFRTD